MREKNDKKRDVLLLFVGVLLGVSAFSLVRRGTSGVETAALFAGMKAEGARDEAFDHAPTQVAALDSPRLAGAPVEALATSPEPTSAKAASIRLDAARARARVAKSSDRLSVASPRPARNGTTPPATAETKVEPTRATPAKGARRENTAPADGTAQSEKASRDGEPDETSASLDASPTRILHRDELGAPVVAEEVTYWLDGKKMLTRTFPEKRSGLKGESFEIFTGALRPGLHDLRISAKCKLSDLGLFTYANAYKLNLDSHHTFRVENGRGLDVTVVPYTDSIVNEPTRRLRVRFEERTRSLPSAIGL